MGTESAKLPVGRGGPPTQELRPYESLRRAVDRMFEEFGRGFLDSPVGSGGTIPAVDVAEHDTEYEITMELPGINPDQVDVSLSNGMLTIAGEKKVEEEKKSKDFHLSERRFGSFRRSFQLPETVDSSAIEAGMSDGVLTIHLPKTARAQEAARKIEVKPS